MGLAQRLYEQGAITYMRTDSPNLSEETVAEARAYCAAQGWPVVEQPRHWKAKGDAQEAHEAIRPTHIEVEEAGETPEERALYTLIRMRVLAAMLEDARYAVRTVTMDGDGMEFEARGRTLIAQGWKVIMAEDQAEDGEAAEPDNPVPAMEKDAAAQAADGKVITKSTKPPARFTEASLVRELERRGIGRPSTYATILETIQQREYVRAEKRFLVPTAIGEAVVDGLKGKFAFAAFEYTRDMETALDQIAEGKADYRTVMGKAHDQLRQELQSFAQASGKACPQCGKPMRRRSGTGKDGKAYDFWGCTAYPECKHTENPDGSTGKAPAPADPNAPTCPDCGKPMRRRSGTSKTGVDYDFWGCTGYPECRKTMPGTGSAPKSKKGK